MPSTNSQPSYVLWLVRKLQLQPGQRVLEIGSGSGWLAAVIARLVGDTGYVTGTEIIPDLAEQSRRDLASLGVGNVAILTADGTQGHAEGAPYDRIIITAATWDLPAALFVQVVDGGRIMVPMALKGGGGCHATLLRREGDHFLAERYVPGWFVPLVGLGQDEVDQGMTLEMLRFWKEISNVPAIRRPSRLVVGEPIGGTSITMTAFQMFLRITELGFAVFERGPRAEQQEKALFGLVDEIHHSVALWTQKELVGYGSVSAVERLERAYVIWSDIGMPGRSAFDLEVVRAEKAPAGGDGVWIERRGDSALIWRLKAGAI